MDEQGRLRTLYLDAVKRALRGTTLAPSAIYRPRTVAGTGPRSRIERTVDRLVRRWFRGVVTTAGEIAHPSLDPDGRRFVTELFPGVLTMVGEQRLDNVEHCIRDVIENDVPGDIIETGVWRGGTTILMRAVLKAHDIQDRAVYVADSFQGLPPPNVQAYPADLGLDLFQYSELAVSLPEVRENFARFGLLDEQVRFLPGWFRDTLPTLRDRTWSVIRLDGDLYESTMDALTNLYPGLSPGGWLIVDDFDIPACARAINDFRAEFQIDDAVHRVDWTAICWKKGG